jgi:hypothetical protein
MFIMVDFVFHFKHNILCTSSGYIAVITVCWDEKQ